MWLPRIISYLNKWGITHDSYSAQQMSGKQRVIRPLRPHDVEHPKEHVKIKLLNHGDFSLPLSLSLKTQMFGILPTSSKTFWIETKMNVEKEETVLVKAPQGTNQ